ncbi:hypothetical protein [Ideonella sp. BN130291]|uniref:hypothetical protein n=1 Tax=Ideonella sp. BN130291 TaxID=3112940 RepID=UPI002E273699|nr:hypothetical protein [Ideonella sp. BN130291]
MSAALIFPSSMQVAPARRVDVHLVQALAMALAELGDIELPDSAPTAEDAQHLEALAPLYLAAELEHAGVLRTAELIAGLFASGAITQPLGPTAQLIADFWRARHERLAAPEREQLFLQVFEPSEFYPLMLALCDALAGQFDNPARPSDVRARVALQQAADSLAGWLAPHAVGMAMFAAGDIVQALAQATHFLRDRLLQVAFGAQDLWGLVATVGTAQGAGPAQMRRHVDLGRQGATVLAWLAAAVPQGYALDPASAPGQQLMAAAIAWRTAWSGLQAAAPRPGAT